eukprot:gene3830-4771_t
MRLSLALIFVVVAFLASVNSQKSPTTCTYKNGNKNYNFTQMINANYYQLQPSGSTTTFFWNVCKQLPNNICGNANADGPLAACQQSSGNYFNTGLLSTGTFQPLEVNTLVLVVVVQLVEQPLVEVQQTVLVQVKNQQRKVESVVDGFSSSFYYVQPPFTLSLVSLLTTKFVDSVVKKCSPTTPSGPIPLVAY